MDPAEIEEANRLRISMGMKPLPVPGTAAPQQKEASSPTEDEDPSSTFEGRQAQAYDNFRKLREAEAAKREREERAAAVKRARELAQRNVVLEGKGMGDVDEDEGDLDAKAWLKKQKKRQKRIDQARQAEEEKEKAEAAAAAARGHTSQDLAGVKVAHDASTLGDDGEQILTLKDSTVLENEDEGDELENINLRDQENVTERLNLKKKKPVYDPNDVDDSGERRILAQYDEEISGKKRKTFTLDTLGSHADLADILEAPSGKQKVERLSLDDFNDAPASDYLDISEIKIKKPKKKKSKSTRKRRIDDDDILFRAESADSAVAEVDGEMEIDSGVTLFSKRRKAVDESFVDDDDLQASLAAQRREALKNRKRVRPEDIAKRLKEEAQTPEPEADTGESGAEASGLVIDEISEFVGALKKSNDEENRKPPREHKKSQEQSVTAMDEESENDGDVDGDVEMEMANVKQESEQPELLDHEELTTTGVDEEKTVAQGLGATLQILKERGLIEGGGGAELNDQFRRQRQFQAEKNRRLAKIEEEARRQRERDRASGLLDRMSVKERDEYARKQNANREYQASKVMNEMFNRGYSPNFEIKYVDEHGRRLDQKEAFKHLSHQFHGKGSGKGKTDKLLKKIEAEKRQQAQSFLDSSQDAGMGPAQPKRRKEAGVRLA